MTLHRFFLPPESRVGDTFAFPEPIGRQLDRVLRLRPGDRVIVLDGSGDEYLVRLESLRPQPVGSIVERVVNAAEPVVQVTLYQGLLKGARMELVLQKCTEIGVTRFVPVQTARSVPRERSATRQRRYEAIVREAAEQSRRGRVPAVDEARSYDQALEQAAGDGPVAVLWEEADAGRLADLPRAPALGLFVGPEGGFTSEEVAQAGRHGAHIVTLGPRILRAETAAIAAAVLVMEYLDGR